MAFDHVLRTGTASSLAALMVLAGGCSRFGTGEVTTSLTSDAESCIVAKHSISAGPVTFEIENKGDRTASYEVRAEGDDGQFTDLVMSERGVAAGDEATMSGKLATGQFQVRCLLGSGQTATAVVRTDVGEAGEQVGPAKTFAFTVTREGAVAAPPPMRARAGDLIKFRLDNRSDRPVLLRVAGPRGGQATALRAESRTSSTSNAVLGSVGTYTVRVGQGGDQFSIRVMHR